LKKRRFECLSARGTELSIVLTGWLWEDKSLVEKMIDIENGGKILSIEEVTE